MPNHASGPFEFCQHVGSSLVHHALPLQHRIDALSREPQSFRSHMSSTTLCSPVMGPVCASVHP